MIDLSKFNPTNREYRKNEILNISKLSFDKFENAIDDVDLALKDQLDSLRKKRTELEKNEKSYFENIEGIPELKSHIVDELMQLDYDIPLTSEHLTAISEMKIIYVFKSFEITMKALIKTAYPEINTKDFYKWENMVAFFKSKGIISKFDGYIELTELVKVNNRIKHDNTINDDIKKIKEFSNASEFDWTNLDFFYKRIKPKVKSFSLHIGQLLIKDLFIFDEVRISKVADDYMKRMDSVTLNQFIEKLQNKRTFKN